MKQGNKLLLWLVPAVAALGIPAKADTIYTIENDPSGTPVTLDSSAVVTYVASQGGGYSVNGFTYNNYSIFVQDGTGGLALFGKLPGAYVPAVGDAVNASGTFSPFHQIPEIGTLTALSQVSSGNSVPTPPVYTIPQVNLATLPLSIAGNIVELNNVMITPAGNGLFGNGLTGSAANESLTISDSQNNSMTMFYWPTSYSSDGALYNTAIPTGSVDLIGIVSVFTSGTTSTPEFTPLQIIPVPEPASLALAGILGSMMIARRCRK